MINQSIVGYSPVDSNFIYSGLEQHLICRFECRDVYLTGRGAAAIYVALKAIGRPGDFVALPSLTCPSIPSAIIASGMKPLFLDIRKSDFNLNPSEIDFLPSSCAALIAPHMFGHQLEIDEIKRKCRERGIFLIEDIAQSFGETLNGRLLGTWGDLTIASFHPSKIIPGICGGALLVNINDSGIKKRIRDEINNLPPKPVDYGTRAKGIAARVNGLMNEARSGRDTVADIRRIYLDNIDLIFFSSDPMNETSNLTAIDSADKILTDRRHRSAKYRQLTNHPLIRHPEPKTGSPLFRYSIILDGDGGETYCRFLTQHLRASGIHASNLYFPSHLIFPDGTERHLKVSEWVSDRIINLWLDDIASDAYIRKTADLISDFIFPL